METLQGPILTPLSSSDDDQHEESSMEPFPRSSCEPGTVLSTAHTSVFRSPRALGRNYYFYLRFIEKLRLTEDDSLFKAGQLARGNASYIKSKDWCLGSAVVPKPTSCVKVTCGPHTSN